MSAWFKYWLALGLLLWVVGCGGGSKQSVQSVDHSQVAQSIEGDAIAAQTVQIDKPTYIEQQNNLQIDIETLNKIVAQRQADGLSA